MREIRSSGSEGGAGLRPRSYLYRYVSMRGGISGDFFILILSVPLSILSIQGATRPLPVKEKPGFPLVNFSISS